MESCAAVADGVAINKELEVIAAGGYMAGAGHWSTSHLNVNYSPQRKHLLWDTLGGFSGFVK